MAPPIPDNLVLFNKQTGQVGVTVHSWHRFYECCVLRLPDAKNNISSARIVKIMQDSFARAKRVDLDKAMAVHRIINNKFKEAVYFYDSGYNLRYVISVNGPMIMTVEIPKKLRKS